MAEMALWRLDAATAERLHRDARAAQWDVSRETFAHAIERGVRHALGDKPTDPSQLQAVACARSGSSYIIQGPPGTGKSQTITNLIADFVARGVEKGPVLGSALSRAEQVWIAEGFPLDRKALDEIINHTLGG